MIISHRLFRSNVVYSGSPDPTTSYSLIERLSNSGDDDARRQVVELYAPFLHDRISRRLNRQVTDVDDIVQEILIRVWQGMIERHYKREKGKFRPWLATVASNEINAFFRRRKEFDSEGLSSVIAADLTDAQLEHEHQVFLVRRGLQQILPTFGEQTQRTFQVWWDASHDRELNADQEDRVIQVVADALGITKNAVYIAKCKVLGKLRAHLNDLI